jgi:hypothetical protein
LKKIIFLIVILLGGLFITTSLVGTSKGIETFFPQLEGWEPKGSPDIYTPDNLFEYINGAADVYLSFDFQKLATVTFENNKKSSFTVDIYRHSNPKNGFGIYTQEKPQTGPFLAIGTQGYYEKGILNFLKGCYYVKLSGYDLGEQDETILTNAAQQVARKLDGDNQFPKVVNCFPEKGKIEHSERYIARNFLGHSFLHSAFVADYQEKEKKFQVFIIETDDEEGTQKILESYLNFIRGKGMSLENLGGNFYRFQDPYYRSSGMMNMKRKGKYIWGLFSKTLEEAKFYIEKIEENLLTFK